MRQTGCGKASFVQSLGKNKIFGDGLKGVDSVSIITLTTIWQYDFDVLIETSQNDIFDDEQNDTVSNESKNTCLTIDCRKSGPPNYRTNADNNFEQFCFYGQKKKKIDFLKNF